MAVYVMSDIHGLWDRFMKGLNKIELGAQDHLYILGDVIDRGVDGIKILLFIMDQPNMTLLMGNHEHMMIRYYEAKAIPQDKRSMDDHNTMKRWNVNHNQASIEAFEACSKDIQNKLLNFLKSLPIALPYVNVENNIYYLVHAYPQNTAHSWIDLSLCEKENIDPMSFLWNRYFEINELPTFKTHIVGHSITSSFQDHRPYQVWFGNQPKETTNFINIDCGCARNNEFSRLAILCLNNRNVIYV